VFLPLFCPPWAFQDSFNLNTLYTQKCPFVKYKKLYLCGIFGERTASYLSHKNASLPCTKAKTPFGASSFVHRRGLEPPILSERGPKPRAYTNSATCADKTARLNGIPLLSFVRLWRLSWSQVFFLTEKSRDPSSAFLPWLSPNKNMPALRTNAENPAQAGLFCR